MDLKDLRNQIDKTDDRILALFSERMEICRQVAEYKKEHGLSVLQSEREKELLDRIRSIAPQNQKDGAAVLFTNIMDISKSLQRQEVDSEFHLKGEEFIPSSSCSVSCQGVSGSYQEEAARKLFGNAEVSFHTTWRDVFSAVESGETDFGILPIQNSTAGSVSETYDLMRKYELYIAARTQIEITHCLAAKEETELSQISEVYSHEQALSQCSEFIAENEFRKRPYLNTAAAAKLVLESSEPIAAICSEHCAKQYGLKIIRKNIADVSPNYTRFICLSRKFYQPKTAGTVSVCLAIPNVKGSLYRLLTKFAVNNLNLTHLESKPVSDGSFDILFYLDFEGDLKDKNTAGLLNELKDELPYFKFLGSYPDIL